MLKKLVFIVLLGLAPILFEGCYSPEEKAIFYAHEVFEAGSLGPITKWRDYIIIGDYQDDRPPTNDYIRTNPAYVWYCYVKFFDDSTISISSSYLEKMDICLSNKWNVRLYNLSEERDTTPCSETLLSFDLPQEYKFIFYDSYERVGDSMRVIKRYREGNDTSFIRIQQPVR